MATGLAAIPLLAAKLWSVYPKLFKWPPFRDPVHALERASILLLTSTVLFELVTGLLNIARWYTPMPFGFVGAHYWTAWIAAGPSWFTWRSNYRSFARHCHRPGRLRLRRLLMG